MSTSPDQRPIIGPPARDSEPLLVLEGLSTRLADGRGLVDISLSMTAGAAHVIAGSPGAGKTALIRQILAARAPDGGRLRLFGRDVATLRRRERPALRRRIGVLFQDLRLIEHLSAFDNAALPPRIAGRKPGDYHDEVVEVLTWVGLGRRLGVAAGSLNEAERRRLALARAVMGRPELIIADEPTGALDGAQGMAILRRLAEIHRAGAALLIATSNLAMAEDAGAPVTVLENGAMGRVAASRWSPAA